MLMKTQQPLSVQAHTDIPLPSHSSMEDGDMVQCDDCEKWYPWPAIRWTGGATSRSGL